MLFLNELKKTLGRRAVILFCCIAVLNCILLFSGEKKRGYFFSAKEYREIYQSEGMAGDPEAQIDFLKGFLNGKRTREYYLASFICSDIEKTLGYGKYLEAITEAAVNYSKLAIFSGTDTFIARDIRKTAEKYLLLSDITTVTGPSRGVVMATRNYTTVILSMLFSIYIVFSLVMREKEIDSLKLTMSTRLGRTDHGRVKLVVCLTASCLSTIILETENWILASFLYGMGDMGRSIQSIAEYQPCIFRMSIRGFMFSDIFLKVILVLLIPVIMFYISCRSRGLYGMIGRMAIVLGAEGFLYLFIPVNSIWGIFKYINVFAGLDAQDILGGYLNLNILGYPVWYLPLLLVFIFLLLIFLCFLSVYAYGRIIPIEGTKKIRLSMVSARPGSVLKNECYRYLVYGHGLLLLIVFFVLRMITFSPVKESFALQEDIYFKQYMIKLEGMYSREKERMIDEEEALFVDITEKAVKYAGLATDDEARTAIWEKYDEETDHFKVLGRVREQALYLKEKHGAFLYDCGYRMLAGEDSGKQHGKILSFAVTMMMVICSMIMYGADYQSGADRLVRSTKKGRVSLLGSREIIGTFILLIIYAIIYLPYTISVLKAYGTQGMSYPACSMQCLSWCPQFLSIRGYLIGLSVLRLILLWGGMNAVWFISTKTRSMSGTFCIGLGISVIIILI